jgi:hypothetical protein
MYLNLLFKSLKTDKDKERVKAVVRRFVQVLSSGGSGGTEFVAGGLYLLGEVGYYLLYSCTLSANIVVIHVSYLALFQA